MIWSASDGWVIVDLFTIKMMINAGLDSLMMDYSKGLSITIDGLGMALGDPWTAS